MKTTETKRVPAIAVDMHIDANAGALNPHNTLAVTFANGETSLLKLENIPEHVLAIAVLHGLKQKLVDTAAIPRDPETGRSATNDDKRQAVLDMISRLIGGEWNSRRAGGMGGAGGLLYRALCRLYADKTPEQIRAYLDGKDKKEQAALRRNPRVAEMIETIKSEGGTEDDDSIGESLLDELNDM